jgi:hypothetical protein
MSYFFFAFSWYLIAVNMTYFYLWIGQVCYYLPEGKHHFDVWNPIIIQVQIKKRYVYNTRRHSTTKYAALVFWHTLRTALCKECVLISQGRHYNIWYNSTCLVEPPIIICQEVFLTGSDWDIWDWVCMLR